MSHDTIRAIFETKLAEYADDKNLRVAYFNTKFTPSAGETYLKSYLIPSTTSSVDLEGKHRSYRGIYQVNVVTPKDVGSLQANNIVKDLEELFPLYKPMYEDPSDTTSFSVQPTTPFQTPEGDIGDVDVLFPFSFGYRADVQL